MLRLSRSFRRTLLMSSTVVFPIVGLLPWILWMGNYVQVKGQRFDPDQELSLIRLDCLDVQEGGQQVHARASKCFYSRLLNRCCCATTVKQLLSLIMFCGGAFWCIIKIGHPSPLEVMQRWAYFTIQAFPECEIMRYGCLDPEVMPKEGVVMTGCRAGQGSHPCLLMV